MTHWFVPLAALLSASAMEPASPRSAEVTQAFDMVVPAAPTLVKLNGEPTLRYELHLTSFAAVPLTLQEVDVLDAASGAPVVALRGDDLARNSQVVGNAASGNDPLRIEPGRRVTVYLDVIPDNFAKARSLRHRLVFLKDNIPLIESGGDVASRLAPLPKLGPPLRGGPWAAVYDPMMRGGHRRVIFATAGRARVPGRFAIDFMPAKGGQGPGADVLAVADGIVTATHDGVPEPARGAARPPVLVGDEAGNYVVLDLGGGRFVHFQHMMPGLTVRPGQKIRRGQVLGRLGSTGHVTSPHLHLHVSDSPALLGSEGQPFTLEGTTVVGSLPSAEAADTGEAWKRLTSHKLGGGGDDLPPPNSIVMFGNTR